MPKCLLEDRAPQAQGLAHATRLRSSIAPPFSPSPPWRRLARDVAVDARRVPSPDAGGMALSGTAYASNPTYGWACSGAGPRLRVVASQRASPASYLGEGTSRWKGIAERKFQGRTRRADPRSCAIGDRFLRSRSRGERLRARRPASPLFQSHLATKLLGALRQRLGRALCRLPLGGADRGSAAPCAYTRGWRTAGNASAPLYRGRICRFRRVSSYFGDDAAPCGCSSRRTAMSGRSPIFATYPRMARARASREGAGLAPRAASHRVRALDSS